MLYSPALLACDRVKVMSKKDNKMNDTGSTAKRSRNSPGVAKATHRQIKIWLIEGRWGPEDRLPSEAELTKELGVSRNSLQKALKWLNDAGAIITLKGSGSWVSKDFAPYMLRDDPNLVVRLNSEEFKYMLEFRQSVELHGVGLAAIRATRADLLAISRALDAMKASMSDAPAYSRAESEFHFAVVEATHNVIYIRAMNAIRGDYLACLDELNGADISADSLVAHDELLQALKNNDPEAATRAMQRILILSGLADQAIKAKRAMSDKA